MKTRTILAAVISALFCVSNGAIAQKTEKLFNGKNLSNWNFIMAGNNEVPANQVYYVQNGVIHIKGNPLGYMYTKEKYGDCRLHLEWRWPEEATNSGIFLLIEDTKNPFPNGIECQLAAGNAGDFVLLGGSDLAEFQAPHGIPRPNFPSVKKTNPSSEKPVGEWNEANIFIKDGTITVYINGVYQNTGTNKVKSGHIGLQSEGKDIEFRNLTITK
ncbi:MAG: DUF1080 domain-containing protein [Tannerellaceae bacterium]|jgi:hypothetical protein|nr:DUF1080 domain-containing protein [Tannerellaceae bacterium]